MPKHFLTKEDQEFIEMFKQDGLYNPDYVEYDEHGVKKTHCQRCGTVVIHRHSEMVRCPHCNKTHPVEMKLLKELPNLVRVRKTLANGKTYVDLLFCGECSGYGENLSEQDEKRVLAQLRHGWAKDMVQSKRDSGDIKRYMDKKNELRFEKKEERIKSDILPE